MSEASRAQPTGNIYDLGYRRYEGGRLGRRYAFRALFAYTFFSIWGIGRSWVAKLFPWGLAVIALLPALVLLAVAALLPEEFELAQPEEFFGFVSIILALFCAVAAPELVGRDQRHHTLSLYFSRALDRIDYASAKLVALALSLFLVLSVPQVFLQLGNAVAADDLTEYIQENIDVIPPVLVSSALAALLMASLGLAIAVHAARRAFSTGAVIAAFVILTAMGGIFVETLSGEAQQFSLLISPIDIIEGFVFWIFGADPLEGSSLEAAGLAGGYYLLAAVAYTAIFLGVIYRRILKMSV